MHSSSTTSKKRPAGIRTCGCRALQLQRAQHTSDTLANFVERHFFFLILVRLGGDLYAIYFATLGVSTTASFNRAGEEFAAWRSGFLRYMHETCLSECLEVLEAIQELLPAVSFDMQ